MTHLVRVDLTIFGGRVRRHSLSPHGRDRVCARVHVCSRAYVPKITSTPMQ